MDETSKKRFILLDGHVALNLEDDRDSRAQIKKNIDVSAPAKPATNEAPAVPAVPAVPKTSATPGVQSKPAVPKVPTDLEGLPMRSEALADGIRKRFLPPSNESYYMEFPTKIFFAQNQQDELIATMFNNKVSVCRINDFTRFNR